MEKFIVEKSPHLRGCVCVGGSKNSALPIMAASLLARGESILMNISPLSDVEVMQGLLKELNCTVVYGEDKLCVKADNAEYKPLTGCNANKIRASFLLCGSLLARFGRADIALPGGCNIGVRPVDLHLKGFECLGASWEMEHGVVHLKTKGSLVGGEIYLDFPSVGATENLILAATLAKGTSCIHNAATEPEIVDLAAYLNEMGGRIRGAGTDTVTVEGVTCLRGCCHRVIPDRIEAGTLMVAGAVATGKITLKGVSCSHLTALTHKLREMGVTIEEGEDFITLEAKDRVNNREVKTLPYPGFPTDLQAPLMALMAIGRGTGIINETVFENRFMHAPELNRMGADIKIEGRCAIIRGVKALTGTCVKATDLRAGAALIISALNAEGTTEIGDIDYVDRGYYRLEKKLQSLGADIRRYSYDI